jgi:hypothetical protein
MIHREKEQSGETLIRQYDDEASTPQEVVEKFFWFGNVSFPLDSMVSSFYWLLMRMVT